jgi:hypothetical protein
MAGLAKVLAIRKWLGVSASFTLVPSNSPEDCRVALLAPVAEFAAHMVRIGLVSPLQSDIGMSLRYRAGVRPPA